MAGLRSFYVKCISALRSQRGRDVLMFLLFIAISTILWGVLSLNQEDSQDVRLPVKVVNVPDSVTLITPGPDALNASVKAKGTQLLKMAMAGAPTAQIDFRQWSSGDRIYLNSSDLKSVVRSAVGGAQINLVFPDTVSIPYTSHPGIKVPVVADVRVSTGPRAAMIGSPRLNVDSTRIFARTATLTENISGIYTEPLRLNDLDMSTTRRLALLTPPGVRAVPDSVDITIDVEPLIIKTRKVVIEPVNVPADIKLITFPAQMEVMYMVPMSAYTNTHPLFRVVADYNNISPDGNTNMIKLNVKDVPANLQNVHLQADSAEFIIEHL